MPENTPRLGPQVVEREGRAGDGTQGQGEQRALEVVAGDAVGLEHAAARAAVDDRPFAAPTDLDGDGLHRFSAGAAAVAGLVVKMPRPETLGAVVAVPGAEGVRGDVVPAGDAGEIGRLARFVGHGCRGLGGRRQSIGPPAGWKCVADRTGRPTLPVGGDLRINSVA